ncbi:MAG: response regulator transcription factor [candidate division NC10 bacterium]|nr:response regulator transcription factor [candidate division NC10 bacterium]
MILVVDDEPDIVNLLKYHLEREGFRVVAASDGPGALKVIAEEKPDLVILDLMLPGIDGLEVCRRIRREPDTSHLPILMLTAKGEEVDKIVGLELGADDYVTKPFSPRELAARVKALLRRSTEPEVKEVFRFGSLEVDVGRHTADVRGEAVALTSKEFELLRALIAAKGRVLSRDFLLERVWGYERALEVESRTVDVHIRRLRSKLGPEAKRILTVKNAGYRFDPQEQT